MPEPGFSPDLLLVVGADLTQLRQQLSQIQRELGIQPVQVQVGVKDVQQAVAGMNALERAAKSAGEAIDSTRSKQAALGRDIEFQMDNYRKLGVTQARAFVENEALAQRAGRTQSKAILDNEALAQRAGKTQAQALLDNETLAQRIGRVQAQAFIDNEALAQRAGRTQSKAILDNEALAQRAGKTQAQALLDNETLAQRLGRVQAQAFIDNEALAQRAGRTQSKAILDNEALTQRAGRTQSKAILDNETLTQRAGKIQAQGIEDNRRRQESADVEHLRNLGQISAAQSRLNTIAESARNLPAGGGSVLTQRVAAAQERFGAAEAQVLAGTPLNKVQLQTLRNELAGVNAEFAATKLAASGADNVLGSFFSRMGRYAQIAGGLTLVYGAMRAVFAGVQEFIEVDKQLARISATMDTNVDRTTVLRNSYDLMREANQLLGLSFSEAGKVVFELEKSLGNNAEQIKAAFLPALTLASLGEGNQTEILRTLVGVYKLFGDTLGDTTPQEKYLHISDALIASSAASIQDIDGFRTALQNVAPVAKQANVSLEATLASLVVLTNGMQSASRAGTGLRQLLVDLQTKPAFISKIFDIPFNPDAPLNATKLLDTIIKKVRELGTDSVKTQAMINAAFPDKRATLAFETLIELYPQYSQALRDVENASGRTAAAQRELSNQVGAALGRLTGSLFDEAIKNVNALFSAKPGDASNIVKAIDSITAGIKAFSDTVQTAIIHFRQLLVLLGLSGGAEGAEGEVPVPSKRPSDSQSSLYNTQVPGVPGTPNRPTGASAGASANFDDLPFVSQTFPTEPELRNRMKPFQDAFRRVMADAISSGIGETATKRINELGRQLPAAIQLQDARDAEFRLRQSQIAEANPTSDIQAEQLRIQNKLSEDLARRKAEIFRLSDLEFAVNDRYLDYDERIAAAEDLLIDRKRERTRAEEDYDRTASQTPKEIALLEQYSGRLGQTYAAERRARLEIINLQRAQADEGAKAAASIRQEQDAATAAAQSLLKEISSIEEATAKLELSNALSRSFLTADTSAAQFNETVQKIKQSLATDVTADTDKLRALQGKLFDSPGLTSEQITAQYDRLDKLIVALTKGTYDKFNAVTREAILTEGEKTFKQFSELVARAIAGDVEGGAGGAAGILEKLGDKHVGIDKLTESITAQRAVLGLWGPEAAQAAMAVAHGFSSVQAVILSISGDLEGGGDSNPAIKRLLDSIIKLGEVVREKGLADLATEIDKQNKALGASESAYGKVGVQADKYAVSLRVLNRRYDDLSVAEQAQIDRLTIIEEKLKNAATISGLVRLGVPQSDAEKIAQQAGNIAQIQSQVAAGIEAIRVLNDTGEVARHQIEEFIQESARATGDFVTFFTSKMRDAANVGGDFWKGLATLAEDVSKAMASSLSDLFFDVFTGKATSAKKVWEDFLNSMLRSISNFLAQQATKAFLNLLLGTGTGGGINFGATGGGGFGGGGGGGDFANSPDSGLVAGLATNVLASYLGGGTGAGGGGLSLQSLIAPVLNQGASAVSGGPGLYSGIANASTNFAAGGVSGVAFGVPTATVGGSTYVIEAGGSLIEFGGSATAGAGTSGLAGTGGSLAGAISSATVVLAALAAAYSVYTGVTALEQNKQGTKGYNAGLGTLSGVAGGAIAGAIIGTVVYPAIGTVAGAIIGGAVGGGTGGLVGGLFGDDVARGVVERQEVATSYRRVDQFLTNFATTKSPVETELALLAQGQIQLGGLRGELPLNQDDQAISIGLKNLVFTQEQFLQAIQSGQYQLKVGTPIPATLEELTALLAASPQGTGQAYQSAPGVVSVPIVNIGQPNQYQDTLSHGAFTQFLNQYGQAGLPGADTSISSYIHAGVNPAALEQANYAIIQTIIGKFAAFRELNLQVNNALNEVLKQTVLPAEGFVDQVRQQAQQFRQIINGLVFANRQEIAGQYAKLNAETNPIEILKYVDTIKGLISARYTDEINLVKQFADALDQLASGFKQVSQSIQDQIDSLNASNLGPTNPLDAFQTAQARFNEAREEFFRDPTPETAARVQQRVQPLLEAAGQIFTRPSPEYQDIFQNTINTLQEVKQDVDKEIFDIEANLSIALGTANSIAGLTEQNTRQMAEDMRVLRAVAEQKLEALGFDIFPTTAVPQAQGGASYTHEGLYYLHEGERVLNAHDAAISRSSGGSVAASLTISSGAIIINGAHDPNATGRAVIEHVENSIRTGRLGRVISDRVRSKV